MEMARKKSDGSWEEEERVVRTTSWAGLSIGFPLGEMGLEPTTAFLAECWAIVVDTFDQSVNAIVAWWKNCITACV
ncbi:hypothetical protein FRX31_028537 [Thalictrum thalictroides]|uniref:Uncharacterized protein n=1 Tax=Thalictrum thalictroides TaxID=46969 RepID=A0A7J6VBX8_THATH|nr:hypothetical protein FRX31_028537 [Thalictrum thalictroides]